MTEERNRFKKALHEVVMAEMKLLKEANYDYCLGTADMVSLLLAEAGAMANGHALMRLDALEKVK